MMLFVLLGLWSLPLSSFSSVMKRFLMAGNLHNPIKHMSSERNQERNKGSFMFCGVYTLIEPELPSPQHTTRLQCSGSLLMDCPLIYNNNTSKDNKMVKLSHRNVHFDGWQCGMTNPSLYLKCLKHWLMMWVMYSSCPGWYGSCFSTSISTTQYK